MPSSDPVASQEAREISVLPDTPVPEAVAPVDIAVVTAQETKVKMDDKTSIESTEQANTNLPLETDPATTATNPVSLAVDARSQSSHPVSKPLDMPTGSGDIAKNPASTSAVTHTTTGTPAILPSTNGSISSNTGNSALPVNTAATRSPVATSHPTSQNDSQSAVKLQPSTSVSSAANITPGLNTATLPAAKIGATLLKPPSSFQTLPPTTYQRTPGVVSGPTTNRAFANANAQPKSSAPVLASGLKTATTPHSGTGNNAPAGIKPGTPALNNASPATASRPAVPLASPGMNAANNLQTQSTYRGTAPGVATASTSVRPIPTPAAQAQYIATSQARTTTQGSQQQMPNLPISSIASPYASQQYVRTQPATNMPRPPAPVTYVKAETSVPAVNQVSEQMKIDGISKDVIDEAENERTRLENRERKKRWREQNEDRNKDNDLRCRVNKRAHKLYGKERSEAKLLWIEEEFNKRKSKRQEKEGKGPDGNLLIEGTDLSSLNHYEMNSVIMSTLTEFASNPAAPALKDNPDLNLLFHKLRTDPQSIKSLFSGQPRAPVVHAVEQRLPAEGAPLTTANMRKMDGEDTHMSSGGEEEDEEEDDDKYSQAGSLTTSVVDMTAESREQANATNEGGPATAQPASAQTGQSVVSQNPQASSSAAASLPGVTQTQHHTYGIGSGFEEKVALALSSELFRLVSMQPAERKRQLEQSRLPTVAVTPILTASPIQKPAEARNKDMRNVKQEIEA